MNNKGLLGYVGLNKKRRMKEEPYGRGWKNRKRVGGNGK